MARIAFFSSVFPKSPLIYRRLKLKMFTCMEKTVTWIQVPVYAIVSPEKSLLTQNENPNSKLFLRAQAHFAQAFLGVLKVHAQGI